MDGSGIVGIYLAAGKSSRMGTNKLNLYLGNNRLGSIAFGEALKSSIRLTVAVTNQSDSGEWLVPFLNKNSWTQLVCREAEDGQSASLKCGVKLASELKAEGLVVMLGDQPFVSKNMINELVHKCREYPVLSYFAFSHKGMIKPPILFSKRVFSRLLELEGDQGARSLIRGELKEEGMQIDIPDEDCFFDIDTQEDYENAVHLLARRRLEED